MKTKTTYQLLIILFVGLLNLQFLCFDEENEDPTCSITVPTNGQEIEQGEAIIITAVADDSDGTITKVDFYIDNTLKTSSIHDPHTYVWNTTAEDTGEHKIKATATDDGDGTKDAEITVTIILPLVPPEAQFEATPLTGDIPLEVFFTDLSQNNPESWQWDFGDGENSTEQNPIHTYNDAGAYSVSLTVTNPDGSDTESKADYIVATSGGGGGGTGEPCPNMENISYEGQVYNTILIGDQCWLKENLNVGEKISSLNGMSDNGVTEKYCYDGSEANCDTYGALYQWKEAMQYDYTEGAQGICPDGWHVPTNDEWKILEGYADTHLDVGDPAWNSTLWRGVDVGTVLKSEVGWNENGNGSNDYGFSALPAGYIRLYNSGLGTTTYFWTSKSTNSGSTATYRRLDSAHPTSNMWTENANYGHSVRCIRD